MPIRRTFHKKKFHRFVEKNRLIQFNLDLRISFDIAVRAPHPGSISIKQFECAVDSVEDYLTERRVFCGLRV